MQSDLLFSDLADEGGRDFLPRLFLLGRKLIEFPVFRPGEFLLLDLQRKESLSRALAASLDGTSMAAPHVSGVAALVASDFGCSGAVYVTGLAPGTYTFRLMDHCATAGNRRFKDERQMLVFQIQ